MLPSETATVREWTLVGEFDCSVALTVALDLARVIVETSTLEVIGGDQHVVFGASVESMIAPGKAEALRMPFTKSEAAFATPT